MEDKIKNENLLRILKLKLCTTSVKNYTEIEDINISNKNFLGNNLEIDLKEIVKLKNLKAISLKFFEINDEAIESLNNLPKLKKVEFYMCDFKTIKNINNNITDITVYCCKDFKKEVLTDCINIENLEMTNSGLVDINEINMFNKLRVLKIRDCSLISLPRISTMNNLEYIYINNVDIQYDFDISQMKKLKLISLNGSKISDKDLYIQRLHEQNAHIQIECRENDLPIG